MADDDDLAGLMPNPPPPDGDRRSKTLEVALRRFDAHQDAVGEAGMTPSQSSKGASRRQLAVLASATLVLVVTVPILLTRGGDLEHAGRTARSEVRSTSVDIAVPAEPSPLRSPDPGLVGEEPVGVSSRSMPTTDPGSGVARDPVPASTDPTAAPDSAEASESEASSDPTLTERRASERSVVASSPTAPASRFAPSPPPADRRAEVQGASQAIVVTGSRAAPSRSSREGTRSRRLQPTVRQLRQWQACTVTDPRREPQRCGDAENTDTPELLRGLQLAWSGNSEGAIKAFEAVLDSAPKSADAYINLGLVRQRSGDMVGAMTDFSRAIRADPRDSRPYYFRSRLLREQGDAEGADRDLSAALDLAKPIRTEAQSQ